MATMTIEERSRQIAEKWKADIIHGGEDLSFTHLEYVARQAATEQDRIARAEERERCIKAVQVYHCQNRCSFYKNAECELAENFEMTGVTCIFHSRIRKAIEEGGSNGSN